MDGGGDNATEIGTNKPSFIASLLAWKKSSHKRQERRSILSLVKETLCVVETREGKGKMEVTDRNDGLINWLDRKKEKHINDVWCGAVAYNTVCHSSIFLLIYIKIIYFLFFKIYF
jgi:hypothetical protein